jgi:hypothetical protein
MYIARRLDMLGWVALLAVVVIAATVAAIRLLRRRPRPRRAGRISTPPRPSALLVLRGDPHLPLTRPPGLPEFSSEMSHQIDSYLHEAVAATGTRMPTQPPRMPHGSVPPPTPINDLRAETKQDAIAGSIESRDSIDVVLDAFDDDDEATQVSARPLP